MVQRFYRLSIAVSLCVWLISLSGFQNVHAQNNVGNYASLKANKVHLRAGPGTEYPTNWIYQRKSLPVLVHGKFDHWRQISDFEGTKGWVHKAMLSPQRYVIITGTKADLRPLAQQPSLDAQTVARLEPGVIGTLQSCNPQWCKIDVQGKSGWVQRIHFWGVSPQEAQ